MNSIPFLEHWIQRLNRNKIFRFTSSIKLAVPLMLALAACVAYGTIIESTYNSEYAKISIYNTNWFLLFLALLWMNIFNATISRYPFKKKHVGFVITHIGLLTLLVGALITGFWGIDGQLTIPEGTTNNQVVLSRLMLSYQMEGMPTPQSVTFDKALTERSGSSVEFLNEAFGHLFRVQRIVPFAKVEKSYVKSESSGNDIAVSFLLRSQFFQVAEWLHSKETPELKMGPATLRLVVKNRGESNRPQPPAKRKSGGKKESAGSHQNVLVVKSAGSSGPPIEEIPIERLRAGSVLVRGVNIHVTKVFSRAVVAQNKLAEGPNEGPSNPAVELEVESKGQKKREVSYAKFENFSLNKDGTFGLSFQYRAGGEAMAIDAADSPGANHGGRGGERAATEGNLVEFHVDPSESEHVQVQLFKNGEFVGRQDLKAGESFQTPWMGMRISLGTIVWGGDPVLSATPVVPEKGAPLPGAAVLVRPNGSAQDIWISEGEVKAFENRGKSVSVYFGQQTLDLPFSLKLNKFSKVDYPGTEMPLSYESEVEISETGLNQKISMNEPLKYLGYTVYQASYMLNEGSPPISVFSVNRDPGRPIKYLGSIILGIGIVVFTLMRSRLARGAKK